MLDNKKARSVVSKVIDPVAARLNILGVTANQITVFGTIGISIAAIAFFPSGNFLIGTLVILLFIFSDLLDGAVARVSGKPNPIGAFLDSTLDRITDAALFGSIVIFYVNQGTMLVYPALITAFSAQLISYIKAKAESQGITITAGIAERPERIILLLTGTGFTALGLTAALDWTIIVLSIVTVITVIQRLVAAYRSNLT